MSQSSTAPSPLASSPSAPVSPDQGEGDLRPYAELQELAELELELAGRGEIDGLQELGERWRTLRARLPERPPRAARGLLERAKLTHERAGIELLRLREALLAELSELGRASRAAHGYAPPTARRGMHDHRA